MTTITTNCLVTGAMELLKTGLAPYVESGLRNAYQEQWFDQMRNRLSDEQRRRIGENEDNPNWDASMLLQIIKNYSYVFLSGTSIRPSVVRRLLDIRNKWAHQGTFHYDETYEALDLAQHLLKAMSVARKGEEVEEMKDELLSIHHNMIEEGNENEARVTGIKLLICDVEGTIFKATNPIEGVAFPSTLTQQIAVHLGEPAVEKEWQMYIKFLNGGYKHYLEWVKDTAEMHKRYDLKKKDYNKLIGNAEYNDGVEYFFNNLAREKWVPVLICGGFQNLIHRAQKDLKIFHGFGACEYHFNEEGFIEYYDLQPSDFEGKVDYARSLINNYKLDFKKDWAFIGDWRNDVDIAKEAPMKFGINPHEELRAVEGLIPITSFKEIFQHISSTYQP